MRRRALAERNVPNLAGRLVDNAQRAGALRRVPDRAIWCGGRVVGSVALRNRIDFHLDGDSGGSGRVR